ncbi:hypothetical protein BH09BAC3_BH09BAC3_31920 [soil metagenome]
MLRLRQRLFNTNNGIKHLFNYLRLDTERLDYGLMFDRTFLGEETRIEKQWAGMVNIKEKTFKIVRSKSDLLKTDISSVIIKGEERMNGDQKQIAITFGVSWKQMLFFLMSTISLMLVARVYLPELFNWMTLLSILLIEAVLILIELRKTVAMFDQYVHYLNK